LNCFVHFVWRDFVTSSDAFAAIRLFPSASHLVASADQIINVLIKL
jgi:hypothetical protein